jgi:hypothetical protein
LRPERVAARFIQLPALSAIRAQAVARFLRSVEIVRANLGEIAIWSLLVLEVVFLLSHLGYIARLGIDTTAPATSR